MYVVEKLIRVAIVVVCCRKLSHLGKGWWG